MPFSLHERHTASSQFSAKLSVNSFQRNLNKPKIEGNMKRMITGAQNPNGSFDNRPKIEGHTKRMITRAQSHQGSMENRKCGYVTLARPPKTSTPTSEFTELSSTENDTYYSLNQQRVEAVPKQSLNSTLGGTEEFSFDEEIEVIVQHFTENPTTTCWVIQQSHLDKRKRIEKFINRRRNFVAIQETEIQINEVYCVLLEGVYHRGKVLYRINYLEVLVHLIDNGRTLKTRTSAISLLTRKPSNSNGLAFQIEFVMLRTIEVDEVLRVHNISINSDGVMSVRCIDENKIFTYNDLTKIPLPIDVPIEMFCLDFSFINIDMGYISVCQNDPEKIKSIDGIAEKISNYVDQGKDTIYRPEANELCLAYVEDEGQWYRAKCIKEMLSNSFKLLLIDYGAVYSVKSGNIRKMVTEFMQPAIMHQCAISGKLLL